jgi:hypothetical protein
MLKCCSLTHAETGTTLESSIFIDGNVINLSSADIELSNSATYNKDEYS